MVFVRVSVLPGALRCRPAGCFSGRSRRFKPLCSTPHYVRAKVLRVGNTETGPRLNNSGGDAPDGRVWGGQATAIPFICDSRFLREPLTGTGDDYPTRPKEIEDVCLTCQGSYLSAPDGVCFEPHSSRIWKPRSSLLSGHLPAMVFVDEARHSCGRRRPS
jgi:hypothetical protein